jgi:hypothetical protein
MPLIYPQKLRDMQGHGFLDIELNEHMTNICEVLPRARQIAHVGPEQTINGDAWRFLSKSLDPEGGRYIGWSIGELYRELGYFDQALVWLDDVSESNRDNTIIRTLARQKIRAPVRIIYDHQRR